MTILSCISLFLGAIAFKPLPMLLVGLLFIAFIIVLVWNRMVSHRVHKRMEAIKLTGNMMQQALLISKNNVVRYVVRDSFIYNISGNFLPGEGISVDEWMSHVHPDDLESTVQWFQRILNGQIKRSDFYYRWNVDFSGKQPIWANMHNVSVPEFKANTNYVVSIISNLIDETELIRQEKEERELTEKYKLIFEHSIIGLSFYDADGWLLDSNKMMREICHFDSDASDAFFSNNNLFEVMPFNEVVDRNNVEELWMCSLSVIPERDMHVYLEIQLHPLRDDLGNIIYIAVAARDVTEEREMYLQVKENDIQLQRANEAIQQYETELRYMMEGCEMQAWRVTLDRNCIEFYKGLSVVSRTFTLQQLPHIFVDQEDEFVIALTKDPKEALSKPVAWTGLMHPMVTQRNIGSQWVQVNSIPEFDEHGRLIGSFGIWRNITNLMSKQDELRRETERANDSGRMKSVFLANMTHEIRTPLNAIVGFSDLLQMIDSSDEKREMIRVIHNNCDMLLRLINDILVLSNVDANAMQIIPEEVDVAAEFNNACQSLAQRVQEPGVEFQKDSPYSRLIATIDSGRLQQVVTNFVTNAVKYTHQGYIRVGYRVEERHDRQGIYLYCEDTGSGIPKDQCERIFERFVKLNDYVQGTGLGLSICKAIIEKCGGEIGVESEVGKGSTFWYWVPTEIKEIVNKNQE